jgi:16S rRNA (cytosine967-C5)-methyltransferase
MAVKKGVRARSVAVQILQDRFVSSVPIASSFRSEGFFKLDDKDQSLVRELVDGVLRNRGRLDFYITQLSNRSITRIDKAVLWILRVALYEMESLRVPHYASVDSGVALCKSVGKTSAKGFVNAVLRQFQRCRPELPSGRSAEALAVRYSHPIWLVARYIERWGEDTAVRVLVRNNRLPEPTVWVNPTRIRISEFCDRLERDGFRCEELLELPNCVRVIGRGLARHEFYRDGYCFFMDASSQKVVAQVDLDGRMQIGDFCAAPGNKSFLLALKRDQNALMVCCDVSTERLRIMRQRASSYIIDGLSFVHADMTRGAPFDAGFDFVLADVPCSGLGTLRSNPDIRWSVEESDLKRFHRRQVDILKNCFAALKKEGKLIYSTCSTEPEENELVVNEFMEHNKEAELKRGLFRTFPDDEEGDGFFAAHIRRV